MRYNRDDAKRSVMFDGTSTFWHCHTSLFNGQGHHNKFEEDLKHFEK